MQELFDSSERGAGLARQLLAFSRQKEPNRRTIDLNAEIESVVVMLRHLVGSEVRINLELAEGIGCVVGSDSFIDQVLLNLVANARDAMSGRGMIMIRTELASCEDVDSSRAILHVQDNGSGIPDALRTNIFDPFFTTKGLGQDVGLGLSTVRTLVSDVGGSIDVNSSPGCTRFSISLPRTAAAPHLSPDSPSIDVENRRSFRARVLVVDDEPAVLKMVVRALNNEGHEVFGASGPGQALAMLEGGLDNFQLVVTDVAMPSMRGTELVRHFAQVSGRVSVLYMSAVHTCSEREIVDTPVRTAELVRLVDSLLSAPEVGT